MLMLLGVPPAIRFALGVVALALGLILHILLLGLAGAVIIVISTAQWYFRRRRGGTPR